MLAQVVIAPRSAVTADNVDGAIGMAEAAHQIVQQVELFQVVIFHVPGTMIAQKMIELRYRIRQITIADAIHHIDVLSGVQMVEPESILLGRCGCSSVGSVHRTREQGSKDGCKGEGFLPGHGLFIIWVFGEAFPFL